MPVYDYKCRDHGLFSELATLADAEKPQPCPRCGALAGRVIRLPPALAALAPAARAAHARNEKSRHAPDTLSARRAGDGRHDAGCGCQPPSAPRGTKALLTAQGEKIFPSHRPWMISH